MEFYSIENVYSNKAMPSISLNISIAVLNIALCLLHVWLYILTAFGRTNLFLLSEDVSLYVTDECYTSSACLRFSCGSFEYVYFRIWESN